MYLILYIYNTIKVISTVELWIVGLLSAEGCVLLMKLKVIFGFFALNANSTRGVWIVS